jgi:hypothetical protein
MLSNLYGLVVVSGVLAGLATGTSAQRAAAAALLLVTVARWLVAHRRRWRGPAGVPRTTAHVGLAAAPPR